MTAPRVVRTLRKEGPNRHRSPTGEVGRIFRGAGLEMVWVHKRGEQIDPKWFSMESVDLLVVVQGRLRVEFEDPRWGRRTLGAGDVLVLPPRTRCRAYRWPRSSRRSTVFVAVYPRRGTGRHGRA